VRELARISEAREKLSCAVTVANRNVQERMLKIDELDNSGQCLVHYQYLLKDD
jgi:hypothetical protein